jgi:hypothetical protein
MFKLLTGFGGSAVTDQFQQLLANRTAPQLCGGPEVTFTREMVRNLCHVACMPLMSDLEGTFNEIWPERGQDDH